MSDRVFEFRVHGDWRARRGCSQATDTGNVNVAVRTGNIFICGTGTVRTQESVVRMEIPTTNLGFAIAARARRKCVETIATTSDYKYRKWTPKPEILISLEL